MSADNPFASPGAENAPAPGQAWAEGDRLVTAPVATLPLVCAKCGTRDAVSHVRIHGQWVPLWVRLTVILSPLVMIVLMMIFRKKFDLQVGLCATHAQQRQLGQWGGGAGVVVAMLLMFAGIFLEDMTLMVVGLVGIFAALVPLVMFATVLRPQLVTAERAEFTGANPELLRAVSER